jgi:hypothetical protein
MDIIALQALDRVLRVDEERRVKAGSDEEEDEGKSSTMPHPVPSPSSPAGELHSTTTPPFSPLATHTPNDDEDDAGAVPSNLSPASLLATQVRRGEWGHGVAQSSAAETWTQSERDEQV